LPGRGVDETVAIHFSYLADPPRTDAERDKALADLHFACQTIVDDQDFRVNESTLPGISAERVPRTFVFGRNEPCAQHWHRQLRLARGEL
jgi:choline monooxygenase